jgi:hypothetical protein
VSRAFRFLELAVATLGIVGLALLYPLFARGGAVWLASVWSSPLFDGWLAKQVILLPVAFLAVLVAVVLRIVLAKKKTPELVVLTLLAGAAGSIAITFFVRGVPRDYRLPVLAGVAFVVAAIVVYNTTVAAEVRTPRLRLCACRRSRISSAALAAFERTSEICRASSAAPRSFSPSWRSADRRTS